MVAVAAITLALPYMVKGQYTPECFILVVCDVGNCCSGYSETAAVPVSARLRQAVRNLEEFRRPNVGIRSSGWKQAQQAFTIYFEGRIPTP
jgi:hypothetical protein